MTRNGGRSSTVARIFTYVLHWRHNKASTATRKKIGRWICIERGPSAGRAFASRSYSDNASWKSRVYFRSAGASTCSSGSVCDLYFVLCSDDKCFRRVLARLQSRSFSVQKKLKKKKNQDSTHCLRSSVELFRVERRRRESLHAILWILSRSASPIL